MSDNVVIPLTGSGDATAIVATDDIGGGVQIQRMKTAFGVGGTATDVTAADPLPTTIAVLNPLDYDTGGGTVSQGIVGIALPASGGPVGVSSSNPLPVTAASFPLPTGAATAANQATEIASLASIDGKITAVNTGAVVVASSALPSGASTSAAQGTGNTSLASIDGKITAVNTGAVVVSSSALPSGASTAAKQPALGTAGTASADVISVQGIASMTPVQVSQATATNLKSEITIAAAQTLATVTTVGTVSTITTLPALVAGSALIGKVGIDQTTLGTTNAITPVPDTTSGWTVAMFTSADGSTALTSTAQVVKASAGKLGGWYIYNPNNVASYVSIYNVAAASVTVGTTNPLMSLCIPAGAAANVEFAMGIPFSNAGWSCAATTTGAGNTAPATALEATLFYK